MRVNRKGKLFVLCSMLMILLTGCGQSVSEKDNIQEIYVVADALYEQHANGEVAVGQVLRGDEDDSYSYASMIAEDKVLVATESLFQSVEGYVVNYGKDEMTGQFIVPESLYYDGNRIILESVEGYDNLYTYDAGL